MKIWSSHLLDNLSNCLMNLKNSGDSKGFKPMTSAMPVQCSNQLSYEVTQLRAVESWEQNVIMSWQWTREEKMADNFVSYLCSIFPLGHADSLAATNELQSVPDSGRVFCSLWFLLQCILYLGGHMLCTPDNKQQKWIIHQLAGL